MCMKWSTSDLVSLKRHDLWPGVAEHTFNPNTGRFEVGLAYIVNSRTTEQILSQTTTKTTWFWK